MDKVACKAILIFIQATFQPAAADNCRNLLKINAEFGPRRENGCLTSETVRQITVMMLPQLFLLYTPQNKFCTI